MNSEYHIEALGGFLVENGDPGRTRFAGQLLDRARRQSIAAGTRGYTCSERIHFLRRQPRRGARFLLGTARSLQKPAAQQERLTEGPGCAILGAVRRRRDREDRR